MPITKFKITTLLERATLVIAGNPYVLDQEYPITQQSQMVASITDIGVPYDTFGFKLGNENEIWSEELFCNINAQVLPGYAGVNTNPIDHIHLLNEFTEDIRYLWEFNNSTDRIIFTEKLLPQYGILKINDIEMVINQVYFLYEFINVTWSSSYQGLLQNVISTIKYRVGNIQQLSLPLTINFISSANLQGISQREDLIGSTSTLTNT